MADAVYRSNFHSQDTRQGFGPNTFRFGAVSDAAAAVIDGHIAAAIAGQRTSLMKQLATHNYDASHPAGTRRSTNVLLIDTNGRVWRQHIRNLADAALDTDVVGLFLGTTGSGGLTPMSAPATLPNSGLVAVTVNVAINELR